ncbi:hypothetical protein EHF33_12915 [Deinococcus psychrotolerans]|uniref:Uncharacterized protein n=1 Tax=Deinococcus psychrotolerans TaxID=2489213 RepID=A0A3G8YH53_9DEIO|nr:hypothetical protein [Deinococcus psychrotolerans]AZI43537.1 hypothetical protein EHF33_12915 [Deinococcus psychrotolerans]
MREQIRRILGLVHAGRLSSEDAAPLLAALHPKLNLTEDALAPLFALLVADGFGPDKVSDILYNRTDPPKAPTSAPRPPQAPPSAPQAPKPSWLGGFDGLAERITDTVERAFDAAPMVGKQAAPNAPRTGTILRIEVEDENGGTYSANLPMSLAPHVGKLIPPQALKSLENMGLSVEALQLLLESNPPIGPLLESEDENGNEVRLTVK